MILPLLGKTPQLDPSVFVVRSADIVGDVEMGEGCSVWFQAVVRGDVHWIRIGAETNIQDGAILHTTYQKWPLSIGRGVSIGHRALLHGCTVGDFCLIGMGATVMDGAQIGDECMVGAHALVTQGMVIPPRSLVVGAPARVVRPLKDEEVEQLHKSAQRYQMYAKWYRDSSPDAEHPR